MTLLLRLASVIAASISRSLRSDILVDPGADGDLQAELGGDRRNQFDAAGRGVQAGSPASSVDSFFRSARIFSTLGMLSTSGCAGFLERRIGNARQDAPEIRRRLLVLEQTPQRGVSCGHKQQNGDDGAHRRLNHTGLNMEGSEPVP